METPPEFILTPSAAFGSCQAAAPGVARHFARAGLNTSTPQGELLVTILAGFATFERHLIKRFGRPRKLDPHQRQEALQRLANGETLVDVARTYAVDPTTIGRLLYNGA
jgi:DNA invertase Pin-like site-specific DNA recombinase